MLIVTLIIVCVDALVSGGLTLMDSRSLFLCISCFSSSTILDMASFSMSCSFSVICRDDSKEGNGSHTHMDTHTWT